MKSIKNIKHKVIKLFQPLTSFGDGKFSTKVLLPIPVLFILLSCGYTLNFVMNDLYVNLFKSSEAQSDNSDNTILYRVEEENIEDFVWRSNDNVFFLKENSVWEHSINSRLSEKITDIHLLDLTQFEDHTIRLGVKDGDLLICQTYNRQIGSPDQFGTTFTLSRFNKDREIELLVEKHFFETVANINCSTSEINFVNNYHGAVEQYFQYKEGDEKLIPVDKTYLTPIPSISGDIESDVWLEEELLFKIDKFNGFVKAVLSPDRRSVALGDYEGYLWVYSE